MRDNPPVVRAVRIRLHAATPTTTRPPRRYVVPGRSIRHNQRPAAVPVACPRSGGDMTDILVQSRCNRRAAERFFRELLRVQGKPPLRLVTDKLKSYSAAHRTITPSVNHDTERYANNLAEVSYRPTRRRERKMRRFRSACQAQQFLSVHGLIQNLFLFGRHRLESVHHWMLRSRSLATWEAVTAAWSS